MMISYFKKDNSINIKNKTDKSRLEINGAEIIVKKKRYRGTTGLYELLFKIQPEIYSKQGQENYKPIV